MSSMLNISTFNQSMNGIITLSDGMGTIIENNSIITGDISANNISSTNLTAIYGNVSILQGQIPPIASNITLLQTKTTNILNEKLSTSCAKF